MKRLLFSFLVTSLLGSCSTFKGQNEWTDRKPANEKESNVFLGTARWFWENNFDSIDSNGIIMNAIDDANEKCQDKFRYCVVKSVHLEYVKQEFDSSVGRNRQATRYNVIVHGIDSLVKPGDLEKFKRENSIMSSDRAGQLVLLSAKYGALSSALSDCYEKGFDLCAIGGIDLTESNNYRFDDNSGTSRFFTSAKASVFGVRVLRVHPTSLKTETFFKLENSFPVPTFDLNHKENKEIEI